MVSNSPHACCDVHATFTDGNFDCHSVLYIAQGSVSGDRRGNGPERLRTDIVRRLITEFYIREVEVFVYELEGTRLMFIFTLVNSE